MVFYHLNTKTLYNGVWVVVMVTLWYAVGINYIPIHISRFKCSYTWFSLLQQILKISISYNGAWVIVMVTFDMLWESVDYIPMYHASSAYWQFTSIKGYLILKFLRVAVTTINSNKTTLFIVTKQHTILTVIMPECMM